MFRYDRLEQLIKDSGKTKTYLCKALDRPVYYLRDVIKQKNAIPEMYQMILAQELGTTMEYLNGETDLKEKQPTDIGELSEAEAEIVELFNSAPEWKKKAALALLRAAENK